MDTTDSKITFDENGVCDHCRSFYRSTLPNWHPDERGRKYLEVVGDRIRAEGKDKDFDCIMGVSGGADSSYMLHFAVMELGLRPLVFHVDGGWNSQIAVNNINVMINKLELELYTEVINWTEMRDFQLSYIKSGLPNIDVPQDHAFIATLYNFAERHKVKYIFNGGNISTECINNPLEWIYYATDMSQIRDIRRRFGTVPLDTYPFSSILRHKLYLRYVKGIKVVRPLNFLPYIKKEAMNLLKEEYGWQPYPQKHFESRFTKFYEGYWLPKKFGFDTRKVQYSSLILTGQMTRSEALEELSTPALPTDEAKQEFEFVATKLDIRAEELQSYFDAPNKTYKDYRNQSAMFSLGAKFMKLTGSEAGGIKR